MLFFLKRRLQTRWPRDWSSDVCSSDLDRVATHILAWEGTEDNPGNWYWFEGNFESYEENKIERLGPDAIREGRATHRRQIGRASCRERVSVVAVAVTYD